MLSSNQLLSSARMLFERFRNPLFITRGSKGSLTIEHSGIAEIPGLLILSKVDTVGAGDSYLAGAASTLAAGYDMETAATIGTFVAGVHIPALEVCILGFVMALFVPAIAWIEEAALIVLLGVVVLLGAGTMFWWIGTKPQIVTR